MTNQQINCTVQACKHNNHQQACTLNGIMVGNCAPAPHEAADTECASFEAQ